MGLGRPLLPPSILGGGVCPLAGDHGSAQLESRVLLPSGQMLLHSRMGSRLQALPGSV